MKRCPQCNRVETDQTLKFCRVDGATLISDSAGLSSSLAEPHAALGAYYGAFAWNFEIAEREIRKATELNPNYATAWHWMGNFLPIIGKNDEAIAAGKRAEELDPLSPIISADPDHFRLRRN